MNHLRERFGEFLRNGGRLSMVVGIDLKNTTQEGLQSLLDLERFGRAETYVYHNESGSIFHPKLYLFRNHQEARLIVGSNNLTEAGLFINVEAGLQLDTRANSPIVRQAIDALESWKDGAAQLSLRLDAALLTRLVAGGYVIDERTARDQLRQERGRRTTARTQPVFGSKRFAAPNVARPQAPRVAAPVPVAMTAPAARQPTQQTAPVPPVAAAPAIGDTVLMRLRMARGTQTQIPIRLTDTFFANALTLTNANTGAVHKIRLARAKGRPNTMKLEMPETRTFAQPMARFARTQRGIEYEVYDLGTPSGNQIFAALDEGFATNQTQTTISTRESATWWRLI